MALLQREVIDQELLFPSREHAAEDARPPWPPDSLLLAMYSYLSSAPDLLKSDGTFRKRAYEEILTIFPKLSSRGESGSRARLLISALFRLGLLADNEGVVRPLHANWRSFSTLGTDSRHAFVWSALMDTIETKDSPSAPIPASASGPDHFLDGVARTLSSFLANFPADRALSIVAIERLLDICNANTSRSHSDKRLSVSSSVRSLTQLGLLQSVFENETEWFAVNPNLRNEPEVEARPVVAEPNFQLTVKPSVSFPEGLAVASMAEIRKFDVYPRYQITKRSFARALEEGNSAEEIILLLETLGASPLPQNIRFTLTSWQKEYRGIALYNGVILTADAERRHLIDQSKAVKSWILKNLAPGVYLLDGKRIVDWSRALARSGIDLLPSIRTAGNDRDVDEPAFPFRPLGRPFIIEYRARESQCGSRDRITDARKPSDDLTKELNDELEKLNLPSDLSTELRARITKKLILFPEQLARSHSMTEKNEAKGVDYGGKVRLVEQALKSGSDLLEIIERTPKGSTHRLLVRPTDVRKSGSDLILHARTLPEDKAVQIKIRKIGLVRKLKSSLYTP
jgi:hypothetical protein